MQINVKQKWYFAQYIEQRNSPSLKIMSITIEISSLTDHQHKDHQIAIKQEIKRIIRKA